MGRYSVDDWGQAIPKKNRTTVEICSWGLCPGLI
jgi:hypothetical protein